MPTTAIAVLILLFIVLSIPAGRITASRSQIGQDLSTRAVVEAAATYVKEYQRQLTSVLADEAYTQTIVNQVPYDAGPKWRTMKSEMFFIFAPDADRWMAIRGVSAVDGKPMDDRRDLREALRTVPASELARSFMTYNSRFNIGRVFRNFNEPTLSLLVLDSNHRERFSFDRKRVERVGDDVLVTLAFAEKESPTLIRGLSHGNVFSKGEVTLDGKTGRISRAFLTGKIGRIRMELSTLYSPDERLGIWVPALFRERYEYGAAISTARTRASDSSAEYEDIVCEARYTNFRRFETSVRLK